jgi:prevent-host-death family protein
MASSGGYAGPARGSPLASLYRYLHSCRMRIMRDVHELSVTEATPRGAAGLVAEAEQGTDLVVTRRNHPVAAVVGIARLELFEAAESGLRDLALVLTRAATDTGRRTSLDDVLATRLARRTARRPADLKFPVSRPRRKLRLF